MRKAKREQEEKKKRDKGPSGPGQNMQNERDSPFKNRTPGNNGADPVKKPKDGVEMKEIDIDMQHDGGEKDSPPTGPGPKANKREKPERPARQARRQDEDEDVDEEDYDGYEDDGLPFFTQVVNRYPKSIIWVFMIFAMASARAAVPFAIAMAYLTLIGRGVQIIGVITNKPIISYVGYGASVLMLVILFFIVMAHEN